MNFKSKLIGSLNNQPLIVNDSGGRTIAFLVPVTDKDIENEELINKITDWRRRYSQSFFSVFEPSYERTAQWLNNTLLPDNNRVLFKIQTVDNRCVGHVGLVNHLRDIELDYIVRGEEIRIKDFMLLIVIRLLKWSSEISGKEFLSIKVRSDNKRMITFCRRLGFNESNREPMQKVIVNDNEYHMVSAESSEMAELFAIRYELNSTDLHIIEFS